ncbi:hypothetical protein CDO52_26450 [Nocardiopsis gilva YIM 90087]|uniref:Thioredoxin domain-containing protein n=1 Tax=Nocardiopsis gilva YIM 90087 TaxID=1235441 RepID=A0A223SCH3_9ACTN|nr:redoxin family protein [Nocardiopsis gilva]ASU85871.1 hypothetical protein CDO52_26450 [Nocardiopsis gilva YIM 90087]
MTSLPPSSGPHRLARRAAVAVLLPAVLTGAAACGSPGTVGLSEADSPSAIGDHSAAPSPQEPVTLATLDGDEVTVPGDKPAVMFFFTAGCGSCAKGAEALGKAHAQAADRADFLAVDIDPNETAEQITGLMDYVGAEDVPAASDTDGALSSAYRINALGTLLITTPEGEVTYRQTNPSADEILAALDEADV